MKALVHDAPETLECRAVPDPERRDDEHPIRILAVGIRGSNMHPQCRRNARGPAPLIAGRAAAGVVTGGPSAPARPGGAILHVGLREDAGRLDICSFTLQKFVVTGTCTHTAQDFRDTARPLFDGRRGPLDGNPETSPFRGGRRLPRHARGQGRGPEGRPHPEGAGMTAAPRPTPTRRPGGPSAGACET